MTWHLTTLACLPPPNPASRLRELEIFHKTKLVLAERDHLLSESRLAKNKTVKSKAKLRGSRF